MNETNFEAGGQLVGHFILHGMTKELNYIIFKCHLNSGFQHTNQILAPSCTFKFSIGCIKDVIKGVRDFDGVSFSNVGDSLWRLVEDRRGKAGWMNSNINNSSINSSSLSYIEFDILLSTTSPRVIIGYMKGYELLGKVKVSFPLHPDLLKDYSSQLRSIVLDGIDPTMKIKATQTHPISIKPSMDSYLHHETLSQVLKTKLRITSLPTNGENQKFKIVFVISC